MHNSRVLTKCISFDCSRADEVLEQLGLLTVAHKLIGDGGGSGISPELRKRLSIGAELVANPSILFLDEPTSGLDSQAAESVMHITKRVAATGVPVICTIHQPSAELFLMFDNLLLMQPGGRVLYYGPLGDNAATVVDYFGRQGKYPTPRENPADFVLRCSGAGIGRATSDGEDESADPAFIWCASPEYRDLATEIDAGLRLTDSRIVADAANPKRNRYAVSLVGQTVESIKRAFMNKYRQPVVNRTFLVVYTLMAVLLGTLYWQMGLEQADARNRVALIYFCIVFAGLGAISSVPSVIQQRAIYYREKPAFLRPLAYFIGMVLAELPLVSIGNVIFASLVYFLAGFSLANYGQHYFAFMLTYAVSNLTCVAFAMMVASAAATTEVANTLVGISLSIFSLFAGFIIPKPSIPLGWIWLHYLSFFKYPLEGLSINEMLAHTTNSTEFNCVDGGYLQIPVGPILEVFRSIHPSIHPSISFSLTRA